MADVDEIETEIKQIKNKLKQMKMDYDATLKDLTKTVRGKVDESECVSTNGGKMNVDLDMQKYRLLNLPLPQSDNEPATKALYDQLREEIDNLRLFVHLKHV